MKMHIIVRYRRLEFRISSISERLPAITHMVQVTVFYSFFVGVKHPSIHHRDPEVMRMSVCMVKRDPIFTRRPLIDKKCSGKSLSIDRDDIDTIVGISLFEEFARKAEAKSFLTIANRSTLIEFEKFIECSIISDSDLSCLDMFENFASVCTSR